MYTAAEVRTRATRIALQQIAGMFSIGEDTGRDEQVAGETVCGNYCPIALKRREVVPAL